MVHGAPDIQDHHHQQVQEETRATHGLPEDVSLKHCTEECNVMHPSISGPYKAKQGGFIYVSYPRTTQCALHRPNLQTYSLKNYFIVMLPQVSYSKGPERCPTVQNHRLYGRGVYSLLMFLATLAVNAKELNC